MDYTKLNLHQCFNLACQNFGLEDLHTIAIGRLLELVKGGYLHPDHATDMARIIYHDGMEVALYDCDDDEESFVDYSDESGFDPYMGCYTGDC